LIKRQARNIAVGVKYSIIKDTLKSALADIQETKEAEFKCHIEADEEARKNR
jgi:hypothetical protein